ncbi:MAG: peptidylprolyl isomerase [Hyphomonadaceae bacterium]
MRGTLIVAALALSACASAGAPEAAEHAATPTPVPSVQEILDQSPASDWRPLDPENTLYMELPQGRVIIELAPHFAPNHAANIRTLTRARFFDGGAIVRSQDNYVVQWGRPDGDEGPRGSAAATVAGEITVPSSSVPFSRFVDPDTYAPQVGYSDGFPVARSGNQTWLVHCYGMVGSGRGDGLDSGSGDSLYAVNGQMTRNLDRNITLVGRVVQGMDILSTMKRGTQALGFYATAEERTPIRTVRLAADVPAAQRTNLETLRTDSATWARLVDSRRTRRDSFFSANPVNRLGVCNISVPVRPVH